MGDPRTNRIAGLIRSIPDFPEPGIQFKDITPLLASPQGLRDAIDAMIDASPSDIDVVCGMDPGVSSSEHRWQPKWGLVWC